MSKRPTMSRSELGTSTEFLPDVLILGDTTEWPCRIHNPVIILPFYREYGHFVNSFIRQVHHMHGPQKIVCCRCGDAASASRNGCSHAPMVGTKEA
jgi:hypothetical protein